MKLTKTTSILLLGCILFSIGLVTVLFTLSENIVHRNNSFLRRYPHHPVTRTDAMDINYNSYYIAGFSRHRIYLGNITAPLHVLSVDRELKDTSHIRLDLVDHEEFDFRSASLKFQEPYFYLFDGTVPVIYRGEIGDWCATPFMIGNAYFSQLEPLGGKGFVIRARSAATNENELGMIEIRDSTEVHLAPALLEKQIDGIFDTDGMLLYNEDLQRSVYVYFYRNEYLVADPDMNLDFRARTIDTVTMANLDIETISSRNENTLGSRALTINKMASTSGNLLFVNSDRLGKYEPEEMLNQASIIDVYDLQEQTYELSFYLYHEGKEKLREFRVFDDMLVALMGKHIVVHKLKSEYFGKIEKPLRASIVP